MTTGAVRETTGDGRVTSGGPVSAADGRQGLEALAIAPAEIDLGAILQAEVPKNIVDMLAIKKEDQLFVRPKQVRVFE